MSSGSPTHQDTADHEQKRSLYRKAFCAGQNLLSVPNLPDGGYHSFNKALPVVFIIAVVLLTSLAFTPTPAITEREPGAGVSELSHNQSHSGIQTDIVVDSVTPSNDTAVLLFTHNVRPGFDNVTLETHTSDVITTTGTTSSPENGTVTVQFTVDNSERGSYFTTMIDDHWVSVNRPNHELTVSHGSATTTYNTSEIHENIRSVFVSDDVTESTPLREATLLDGFILLSPQEATSHSVELSGTETSVDIRNFAGGNASLEWSAETIAVGETLIDGTSVSTPNRSLTLIIRGTNTTGGPNGITIDRTHSHTTLYVDAEDAVPGRSTVPHEWAHSFQHHETNESAMWWIEGSAVYLSRIVRESMASYGHTTEETLTGSVASTTALLNDPATWEEGSRINYDYGGQVVYLMDLAIRDATGGNATIIEYTDSLNKHEGVITHDVLVTTLEEYGATDFASSLDKYVNSTGASIHVGEEVHRHDLLVDEVGNRFTLTVELPNTPEIVPTYSFASP